MKRSTKCLSRWATAIFAVGLAAALAPVSRAGDPPSTSPAAPPASASSTLAETQQRLQDLEKEMQLLQREIASLKESQDSAPGLKTVAYVQPASQPAAVHPHVPLASAPDEAPKTTIASLLGPTSVSGFVDAYYGFNFNHPADQHSGLRFFDRNTNQFGLNLTGLVVDKQPDATGGEIGRTGYHVALAFGQAVNVVNSSEPVAGLGFDQYLKEAYFSYLAPVGKGLQIDIGKFVTGHGAEVIETKDNWNYSRSILFYYAIPYFHFGARAKYTFNEKWAVSGYLVNGWNNVVENNSGKTYGGSIMWSPTKKLTLMENYMAGPEQGTFSVPNANSHWRQLSDTVITYSPTAKWSFVVNGDYGRGDAIPIEEETDFPVAEWWGVAGYAKYNFNDKNNFAVRYEYFGDPQGFTLFGFNPAGHAQEVTATYTHMLTSALMTRFEYRADFASSPIFLKGTERNVNSQHTATIGFVYMFDSRNAK